MKKLLTILCASLLLSTTTTLKVMAQDKKNQKAQSEKNNSPQKGNGNNDKVKQGKNDQQPGQPNVNNNKGNEKKNQANDNKNNNNTNNGNSRSNNDNRSEERLKNDNGKQKNEDLVMHDGFTWDRESFKERKKIKNANKVTICHKFNNNEPNVSIRVSENALKAHINHGDVVGDCPAVKDDRYSDIFFRNRNDYYNNIQNTTEQVSYSRSILNYAISRLTNSRQQLALMQNNNMPDTDIRRKQATVVELEHNVSVLESLLGVATSLVANKL